MLVDRETGHCIVTSSWETEEAMVASDAQLRPVRDRGRDILGGSMEIDEWEITLMHHARHAERVLQRQPDGQPVGGSGLRHDGLGEPRCHGGKPLRGG
jgi:hypothetical protein